MFVRLGRVTKNLLCKIEFHGPTTADGRTGFGDHVVCKWCHKSLKA